MKRADIEHLALLARIRLTEEELSHFETELSSIMSYVSVVSDIAGDDAEAEPKVGAVYNVFRQDEITNQPDEFTKDIIAEMPNSEGRFLSVKKILQTDN
ncbi:Asp-tRNA(Asn)/Glu-tRNA(Gln) amidotransferase subunit GatC [Candidatus Nomurabacteria bacterium]|nr:Asp-tRNA(Asn)/Glu-tRNA(Gln) amidotransferase subunit GatC [Candidatus Kaiserbacteria bacterium]MCB9814897.1 Asp-tRNA(Asn)/Glu-tRNA(Gln) amidotransferase subunit GatC [Candidatus Nomurabacteria bacterium]